MENLKKSYGFNKFFLKKLEQRLESSLAIKLKDMTQKSWAVFINTISPIVPKKSSLKKRTLLNIFLLDLITSYKGWRHYKGLPVRGQRTWTNAWSSFRSNVTLRNYKIKVAKKFYGNLPTYEVNVALAAEQINVVWKTQWYDEWFAAKLSRLNFKGNAKTIKIDLYSMANGQIMNPAKFKKMTKKQKQSFKKNHFTLGFDPGFTKPLLRELYKSRMDPDYKSDVSSKLLFRRQDTRKKKNSKKKVDIRAKKLAHDAKKKKKKSVWDL